MISEDELSRHCTSRTMQRARQIAASPRNILTQKCRYDADETIISAFVASSHGWDDRYRTSVTIQEREGSVQDYSCTCPAYREYAGMCKHCVALALSFQQQPDKFMGYLENHESATSQRLSDFMKRVENREGTAQESPRSIHLETILSYGYHHWSVHFKVAGPSGSYVMKGIGEFLDRMRAGEYYSYGKKLAFTHTPLMLTDDARHILRFLEGAIATRSQAARSSSWRFGGHDAAVGRDLDLSAAEVVELLDALGNQTFTVEGTDYATRSVTHAHIADQDPHVDVFLRESDRGGYGIPRTDDLVLVSHADRLYVWLDDVFYRCSDGFARSAEFLKVLYEGDEEELFVSTADLPLFCATALPAIENSLDVHVPAAVEAFRPVPCQLEFYFDRTDKLVTCDAKAKYGDVSYPLLQPDAPAVGTQAPVGPLRNQRVEDRAGQLVSRFFEVMVPRDADDGQQRAFIEMGDEQGVAQLLFGGLAEFQLLGDVFTTPPFDRLLSDAKPHVTLGASLAGNLINLELDAGDLPADELAALLASYRLRKRYHRLRSGAFLDLAGYDLSQLDRIAEDLDLTAEQLSSGLVELPTYRAFYLDQELDPQDKDQAFMQCVDNLHAIDQQAYQVPAGLHATLRPYQVAGFRWLSALADMGFGGILADEMGLGKSVQLISLLLARAEDARDVGPSLIVCPASLVYNWLAEFERFAPQLRVQPIVGMKAERMRARREGKFDVWVTSYDLLRIDVKSYADLPFYCCALDEAQYIKNPATLTTRATKKLRARQRFALTGTPMENRLSELWSIFDFLTPGLLGSYMRFRERYELDIIGGDEEAARRLQALVGPFMLRRLKTEVLTDLPDKLESAVYTHLGAKQMGLYSAHEQKLRDTLNAQKRNSGKRTPDLSFGQSKVEVLAELTKLRQLCCDPRLLFEDYGGHGAKLDTIMDLIESAMDAGQKTLVFSQFTSFLALIAEQLDAQDIPYYTITGATPKARRLDLVNAFNADETPVFLVSLKAGGTGLNLTGASVVVHADPWWNAAAQNQATDRAHRIGQTQVVSVHKVIAKGTIEERIMALQAAKSELADQIMGAEGVSLASLTREDLLALLEG